MKTILHFALAAAFATAAPSDTQLTGAVTDTLGGAISGAMILIHWDPAGSQVGLESNVGIKQDTMLTTDTRGNFSVQLPPGFYDLFVSATAFTPASRKIRLKGERRSDSRFRLALDPKVTSELD